MTAKNVPNRNDFPIVLILSPDAGMTGVWKTLFEKRNCRVVNTASAWGAVSFANLLSPALILLDLDLPEGDLLALCRDLRDAADGTILLIHSRGGQADALEFHRAGVDEVVAAGINPMALLSKGLAWLARGDWVVPRNPYRKVSLAK